MTEPGFAPPAEDSTIPAAHQAPVHEEPFAAPPKQGRPLIKLLFGSIVLVVAGVAAIALMTRPNGPEQTSMLDVPGAGLEADLVQTANIPAPVPDDASQTASADALEAMALEFTAPESAAEIATAAEPASFIPVQTMAADMGQDANIRLDDEVLPRLERVEQLLTQIQEQQRQASSDNPPTKSTPAAPQRVAAVAKAKPAKPQSVRSAVSEPDPTTVHGGQLLSVDMWGGEPSVVVGTGLSDDRRLRILRKATATAARW